MAISLPFVGSGEFAPERVWSCPVHDDDISMYDEGWNEPGEQCLDCETGVWRDRKDENGNVVMYELSVTEKAFRDTFREDGALVATTSLFASVNTDARFTWSEDEFLPSLRT